MSTADRPIELRKPLSEWAPVPRWVLDKVAGDVAAERNLKVWAVEGPRLCWPEDLEDAARWAYALKHPECLQIQPTGKLEPQNFYGTAWWRGLVDDARAKEAKR